MLSVIPEKHAALTTFGFTINSHFCEIFLAAREASPANPPIDAPTPVGTINATSFLIIRFYHGLRKLAKNVTIINYVGCNS